MDLTFFNKRLEKGILVLKKVLNDFQNFWIIPFN